MYVTFCRRYKYIVTLSLYLYYIHKTECSYTNPSPLPKLTDNCIIFMPVE